jgi:hypothetical protein
MSPLSDLKQLHCKTPPIHNDVWIFDSSLLQLRPSTEDDDDDDDILGLFLFIWNAAFFGTRSRRDELTR